MDTYVPKLHLLDRSGVVKELDLASELFHRINRIIPPNQELLTILPTCRVRDAIALMLKHGYSQIPVVQNGEVLGVFSYRSFAKEAASVTLDDLMKQRCTTGDLRVDEFLEQFEFARVTEEMSRVFDAMDRDNGVLIGSPDRLIGILTPMDFLRYLYHVASPFVMVSEIELALRALIRLALDEEQIGIAARRSLAAAYGSEDKIPMTLEDMSFDNYQSLISNGENWMTLEAVFGGTRTRVSAKLKEVGEIRNALFHFRREITVEDHQTLADHRNWLLIKVKQAETGRGKEEKP
jgi:predicted transcriptional regulator